MIHYLYCQCTEDLPQDQLNSMAAAEATAAAEGQPLPKSSWRCSQGQANASLSEQSMQLETGSETLKDFFDLGAVS